MIPLDAGHLRPLAVFALALVVRLAAVAWAGPNEVTFGDARDYLDTARQLCEQGSYPERGNLPYFRAPGLPFFIAGVTLLQPDRVAVVKVTLAVTDSLLVLVVYSLALVITRDRTAALLAALGIALHPMMVAQVTDIRSEPLFTLLLTTAVLLLFVARQRERVVLPLVGAGVALALATLTRPVGLVAIPFLVATWLLQRSAPRRVVRGALALAGGCALTMAPWVLLMAHRYGELILVNDAGGCALWRGSHPELFRALTCGDPEQYWREIQHFEEVTVPQAAAVVEREASTPMQRSRAWTRLAVVQALADPRSFLRITLWKAVNLWRPWLHPLEYGRLTILASALFLVPLFVLGAVGLWRLRTADGWAFRFVLGWLVLAWLAHIPFHAMIRYRMPFTDPLLMVLAATVVVDLARRVRSRPNR